MAYNDALIVLDADIDKERLDIFLLRKLHQIESYSSLSRSQIKKLLESGSVQISKKNITKAGYYLKTGDRVEISLDVISEKSVEPYEFPLSILYEDQQIIVIDKPSGISMHPGAGNSNKTVMNAVIAHDPGIISRFDNTLLEQSRVGIVHRLDKDTTGVVVVAKSLESLQHLSKQFEARTIHRNYISYLVCRPKSQSKIALQDSGRIETQIGRDPNNRLKMKVIKSGGKNAITNWQVLDRYTYGVKVKVKLETGRTHQIRVHFSDLGTPVFGDRLYGSSVGILTKPLQEQWEQLARQALHAESLGFLHPITNKTLQFTSDLPQDLIELEQIFQESN